MKKNIYIAIPNSKYFTKKIVANTMSPLLGLIAEPPQNSEHKMKILIRIVVG